MELRALMRATPGHVESPDVKDLTMRGEESLVEKLATANHLGEANLVTEAEIVDRSCSVSTVRMVLARL